MRHVDDLAGLANTICVEGPFAELVIVEPHDVALLESGFLDLLQQLPVILGQGIKLRIVYENRKTGVFEYYCSRSGQDADVVPHGPNLHDLYQVSCFVSPQS